MTYYADEQITLHHGDALDIARTLPDGAADCIVTSPPYFGLRDYGIDGQYGLEASPAEYVETMRGLFAELRRVLADDGTLWLNIGDSYSGYHGNKNCADDAAPSNKPGYWENMRESLPGAFQRRTCLAFPGVWLLRCRMTAGSCVTRSSGRNRTRCQKPSETGYRAATSMYSCSARRGEKGQGGRERDQGFCTGSIWTRYGRLR